MIDRIILTSNNVANLGKKMGTLKHINKLHGNINIIFLGDSSQTFPVNVKLLVQK